MISHPRTGYRAHVKGLVLILRVLVDRFRALALPPVRVSLPGPIHEILLTNVAIIPTRRPLPKFRFSPLSQKFRPHRRICGLGLGGYAVSFLYDISLTNWVVGAFRTTSTYTSCFDRDQTLGAGVGFLATCSGFSLYAQRG